MKHILHCIYIILASALTSGCVDAGHFVPDEGKGTTVTFMPVLDGRTDTRSIGDASHIDRLQTMVFEEKSEGLSHLQTLTSSWDDVRQNGISLNLVEGRTYRILFWAEDKDNTAYNIGEDGVIAVSYDDYLKGGFARMEQLDAFHAVSEYTPGTSTGGTRQITLTRPLAQLNFADNAIKPVNGSHTVRLTFHSVPVALDPFSGKVKTTDHIDGTDDICFTFTDFSDEPLVIGDNTYNHLACNYFLTPSEGIADAAVTVEIEKDGALVNRHEFKGKKSVVLERNKQSNVIGKIAQSPVEWSVWDGTIPATSPLHKDRDRYIIDEAADLAWLSVEDNAAVLPEGCTLELATDIDMAMMDGMNPIRLPSGAVIDGKGHTVKGLKLDGGFLGNGVEISVHDLTVEDSQIISSQGHKGILIDRLQGSARFSNVTIRNSSVSTSDGSAGGMIGYICRKDPASRSEKVEVFFEDCHVDGNVVDGSLCEGHFVGLLSGYDGGEILSFSPDCSMKPASGIEALNSIYIEGNEGAWLSGNDYSKYDAWLGGEEYYRGTVNYGGIRFIPKWDGKTAVEPLLADPVYDDTQDHKVTAGASRYSVYSAFDLAGVRSRTASPAALYFKENVDMNGQGADGRYFVPAEFSKSADASADDNHFTSFSTVTHLDGQGHGIYNLSIYSQHNAGHNIANDRAAFIINAIGTTVHKNISLHGCRTAVPPAVKDNEDKSYGAAFVSHVGGDSYTMENVHTYDCKVFALQKVGSLAARLAAGTSTITGCTANDSYLENYECKDHYETFSAEKSVDLGITTINAKLSTTFYSYGEVGGLIGFVENNATITDCHVRGAVIDAFGQDDRNADVSPATAAIGVSVLGYYTVPGRHVSTFIGDIRTSDKEKETIRISDCTVDSQTKCINRHDAHNNILDIVGRAYFLEFKDSEGSLYFNGTRITLMNCKKSQDRDQ